MRANEPYWNHLVTFVKGVLTNLRASIHITANRVGKSSPAQTSTLATGPSYLLIACNAATCISVERLQIVQVLS